VDEGGDQLDRNGGQDIGQEYRASRQGIAVAPRPVPCIQREMGENKGSSQVVSVLFQDPDPQFNYPTTRSICNNNLTKTDKNFTSILISSLSKMLLYLLRYRT
jgi:hypothetical protein